MKKIYTFHHSALFVVIALLAFLNQARAQVTLNGQGIQLVSQSDGTIQVNDGNGTGCMVIGGFDLYGNGTTMTPSGTASLVTTGGVATGIQVNYNVVNDPTGAITLTGLFTFPNANCVHVHYTLGAPSTLNLSGNLLFRWALPSASFTPVKLGKWTRDANGGVPYEAPDMPSYTVNYASGTIGLLKIPNANQQWNYQWDTSAPPVYNGSAWTEDVYFYVPSTSARTVIQSTALLGNTVAVDAWTTQDYNIWYNSVSYLTLFAQAANTTTTTHNVTMTWTAHNYSGAVVASGSDTQSMNPGQTWTDTLSIPAPTEGIIFVEVDATDGTNTVFTTTNLAILPPYTFGSGSESIFGLSATFQVPSQTSELTLLKRMGVRWLRMPEYSYSQAQAAGINQAYLSQTPDGTMNLSSGSAAFVDGQLATAAADHSPTWEFANEVNLFGEGEAANYASWLSLIHSEKVNTGSSIKIMNGGLAGMDGEFVTGIYNAGGWPYLDAFALHPARGNCTADNPGENNESPDTDYWNYFGAVRSANVFLARYGTKPLYLTEVYACTAPNFWWTDSYRQAAENVVLSYALAMEENVKTLFFYQLNDSVWTDVGSVAPTETDTEHNYGLLHRDLSPKPSLLAYCTVAQALDQATFAHWMSFKDPNTHGLMYNTPRGPVAILWNRDDGYLESTSSYVASPQPWVDEWPTKTTISLPTPSANSTVTVVDCIGESSTVTASNSQASLTLDGAPRIVYGLAANAGQSTILDNSDTVGVTTAGTWTTSAALSGYYGANYAVTTSSSGYAQTTYTPHIGQTGSYQISMWFPGSASNSSKVPVTIHYAGGTVVVEVNETTGGQWINLGAYDFNQGMSGSVTISNAGTTGNVIADAVSFAEVEPSTGQISWNFNDFGINPTASDSSGNGYTGTSAGNITGNGTTYSGFSSTSNYVEHAFAAPFPSNLTSDPNDMWDQNFTFLANISNPGSNTTNLIARGGSYWGGDNAWQLSMSAPVSGNSTFTLVMGTWWEQCITVTSNPVAINPGTTYQVALVWNYSYANSVFTIGYNLYVTPVSGTSAPALGTTAVNVMSGSQPLNAGPSAAGAGSLIVGGAGPGYCSAFTGGSFGGNISNVRLITGAALSASQVEAFQVAPNPCSASEIFWKFNESGTNPVATDYSGSGYTGTSSGSITGSGTSYSGFTSTGNYVSHAFTAPFPINLTSDPNDMWDQNFTFIADISHSGSNTTNLIARGGSYSGGDNAWQLSMSAPSSGTCTFSLVIGNWYGGCTTATSSAVTVNPSTTYQVALVWNYSDSHVGGPTEFTYGYTVYLTPTTGGTAVSIMTGSYQSGAGPSAAGAGSFYVGGAGNGYYSQFLGGSFGGNISNVELITGSALTGTQIRALP